MFRVYLTVVIYISVTSPIIYRDHPEWLPLTLAPLALIALFATRWRINLLPGMILFAIWASFSSFWTYDASGTAIDIPNLILSIVLGMAVSRFGARTAAVGVFVGALIATMTSVLLGIFIPKYGRSTEFEGALTGVYAHRNLLASVVIVGMALSVAFLISATTVRSKFSLTVATVFFVATAFATLSGTAIVLSALVVVGAVAVWLFRNLGFLGRAIVIPILLVLAGGIGVPWAIREIPSLTGLVGRDATFTGRIDIWNIVLTVSSDRPVLGYGWGGVWRGDLGDQIRNAFGWDTAKSAHNAFLDALIQVGWVGAGLLVLVIIVALFRSIRLAMTSTQFSWLVLVLLAVTANSASESQATRPEGIFLITLTGVIALQQKRNGGSKEDPRSVPRYSARPATPGSRRIY